MVTTSGNSTDYISKINANNTDYQIGGDAFDGQWVYSYAEILNDITLGGGTYHTYPLSSYLPNDNYDYEVIFYGTSSSTAKSGNVCQLTLFSGTTTTDTMGWRLGRCQARTAYTVSAGGSAIIPIRYNDRNVTVYTQDATTNNTSSYLRVSGYRRIGKNTSGIGKITAGGNTRPIGGNFANGNVVMFNSQITGLIQDQNEKNILFWNTSFASDGTASSPYSVANCIPNDGYDYELCLSFWSDVTAKDKSMQIIVNSGGLQTIHAYAQLVGRKTARTNANHQCYGTIWIPVFSSNKYISVRNIGNTAASVNCQVHGYRRIGTNSYDTLTESYGTNIVRTINSYLIGGNNFDGQWVFSTLMLANGFTINASSATPYSLSSYLPNDGYDYMVAFGGWGRATTSGQASYKAMSGTQTYNNVWAYGARWMCAEPHSSATYACAGNFMLPISANDKNITIANVSGYKTDSSGLYVIAYRRLGTNT